MHPNVGKLTTLLGSASLVAMYTASAAQAQQQVAQAAEEAPETVLVTGSLIRGTVAVGVPVTNVSSADFVQTGALTGADLFRSFPAANVSPGPVGTNANNNIGKQTRVNIRNLDPNDGTRSLLMVDGYRFPPQGEADCTIDPSIIPQIALDRIDILVDGASATYGSDAIAGVVNIILKRGYDGAMTQLRYSTAKGGGTNYQASQLWGRTWDGGDITLSYEWTDSAPVHGNLDSKFTLNFTPWGLDDRTPIRSAIPGIISTGATSVTIGTNCTNCWSVPKGTGTNWSPTMFGGTGFGPTSPSVAATLNWGAFNTAANTGTNGARNEFNPYLLAQYNAGQQSSGATMTIDQRLTKDIEFFGEAFYKNRRAQYVNPSNLSPSSGNEFTIAVPTWNPYYPTGGAPSNLRVSYNLAYEMPSVTSAVEISDRYLFGLNFDLPAAWKGKIFYGESYDNTNSIVNEANTAATSAALGWTIASSNSPSIFPPIATWKKPATVPYLNLFCDPTAYQCNSMQTLQYINGRRDFSSNFWVNEKGVTFDGPLFELPGGDVKAAIGANYTTEHFLFKAYDSTGAPSLLVPALNAAARKNVWAVFTQVNIPLVGEANALPLVRRFDLEGSWRHDQYSDFGGTSNPKVAFTWTLSEDIGFSFKGSWGTSFRAPTFAEQLGLVKNAIAGWNSSLFQQSVGITFQSANLNNVGTLTQRLFNPGTGYTGASASLLDTSSSTTGPVGMAILGAAGTPQAAGMRDYTNTIGQKLGPEKSTNWGLGFEFAPTTFLKGLDIQATWYKVKITDALRNFGNPTTNSVNDPTLGFAYIVPTDVAKALVAAGSTDTATITSCSNNNTPTACAPFQKMVAGLLADPRNPVNPSIQTNVMWINDGATLNAGWFSTEGIDFTASYDFDLGDYGAWNTGIVGTYYMNQISANFPGRADVPQAGLASDILYHSNIASVGGIAQNGIESLPRLRYRARLGWTDGTWSVITFMDYQSHFFHTQNAPPNVNNQCVIAGGTAGGGTNPCQIFGYTNLEPSYYTFDLSLGYDTGETPANDYLKHVNVNVVIQNLFDKRAPFEYRIGTGGGNPCACDITKSIQGRTIGVTLTKTW